jgi:hypothetical protein
MDIYACIWRASKNDEEFDQQEFDDRMPRLFDWLKTLKKSGHLIACGGGGFYDRSGGLTLIYAENPEQALELSNGTPLNEIGTTELMQWGVFYADLNHSSNLHKLE